MVFLAFGMFATASYAELNVISSVTTSPSGSATVGTMVTITVSDEGENSICGSSIAFGDGVSDSRSPQQLPHVYTHSYGTSGVKNINVSATGGICSGTPSTTVTITKKLGGAYPIPFSTIRSISGSVTARWGRSYRMKVLGSGNCKLRIDWGDGGLIYQANNYNLSAPVYLYHKYKLRIFPIGISRTFTIKVTPMSTRFISLCKGSASKSVRVGGLVGVAPNPAIRKAPAIKKSSGVRYQVK